MTHFSPTLHFAGLKTFPGAPISSPTHSIFVPWGWISGWGFHGRALNGPQSGTAAGSISICLRPGIKVKKRIFGVSTSSSLSAGPSIVVPILVATSKVLMVVILLIYGSSKVSPSVFKVSRPSTAAAWRSNEVLTVVKFRVTPENWALVLLASIWYEMLSIWM